jgi:hypothetical protein
VVALAPPGSAAAALVAWGAGRAAVGVGVAAIGAPAIGLGRAAIGVGVDPIGVGVTHCGGATAAGAGEAGGPALPDWAWAWDGTIPAGTIITTHFAPMVTATLVMPMVTVILIATDTQLQPRRSSSAGARQPVGWGISA